MENWKDEPSDINMSNVTDPQITENEVLIYAKESREKLLLAHDNLKEKLSQIIFKLSTPLPEDEKQKLNETFKEVKFCLGRCELGVSDSVLLISLAEYLQSIESIRGKLKIESRRLLMDNKRLKISAAEALDSTFTKEATLASITEEKKHWISMCQLAKMHEMTQIVDEEHDIWDDTIFPDSLWEANLNDCMEPNFKEVYDSVFSHLESLRIVDALNITWNYFENKDKSKESDSLMANEAILFTKVAKQCADNNFLNESLNLLHESHKLRVRIFGESHKLSLGTLNNKAIVYWKMGQHKKAAACAFDVLRIMEKSSKNPNKNPEIGKQYLRTGYLLTRWGYTEDGIKLMELAAMTFEALFPQEEENWMCAIVKIARACNDCKSYEDAMCVCCELIDFFHQKSFGPISSTNKTIYEIAAEQQDAEAEGKYSKLPLPPAVYLPPVVVSALRELAIVFSSFFLFTAAKVIDKWIEQCMGTPEYHDIIEKAHQRVYQLLGKDKKVTNPQQIERQSNMAVSNTKFKHRTIAVQSGNVKIINNKNKDSKSQKSLSKQVTTRLNSIFKSNKTTDDPIAYDKPRKKSKGFPKI